MPISGKVYQCRAPEPKQRETDEARKTQGTDGYREGKRVVRTNTGGETRARAGVEGKGKGP